MLVKLMCLVFALLNGWEKDRVQAKPYGVSDGFKNVLKFWFPEDAEFNKSCVSEGCPALKNFNLCPNDINITVLDSVLKTAIDCMRKPVCGILIDNRPTIIQTTTTDDWLPDMEIDGNASTLPGGRLSNVSNIELELLPDHNQTYQLPLQLTMFISNLRMLGSIQMELSFRTMLPSIIGQALSVNLPDVKYDVAVEYISTMSINYSLTRSNFDIKFLNPIIKGHPTFCGLDMPAGFPSILAMFTSMTQNIIEKSPWAVQKSAFLERYFQSAIHTVSNYC